MPTPIPLTAFRPTSFDAPLSALLPDRSDWLVVAVSNRNLVDEQGSEVHKIQHWLQPFYIRIVPGGQQ